jgi:hypothetical protein
MPEDVSATAASKAAGAGGESLGSRLRMDVKGAPLGRALPRYLAKRRRTVDPFRLRQAHREILSGA